MTTRTRIALADRLDALGACEDAIDWVADEGHRSLAAAWAACPRGDWMLWLAARLAGKPDSVAGRRAIRAGAACVRATLSRFRIREERDAVAAALAETERWLAGGPAPTEDALDWCGASAIDGFSAVRLVGFARETSMMSACAIDLLLVTNVAFERAEARLHRLHAGAVRTVIPRAPAWGAAR